MAFAEYTEFIEPMVLPIRGKRYTIPPMSLETGLKLAPLLEGKVPDWVAELGDEFDFEATVLGEAADEMRADGVQPAVITRACLAAFAEYKNGRATAELVWKTGGDPKAIEAYMQDMMAQLQGTTNRETRRKVAKASKPSPDTGAASTTKRPASSSTTKKSRRK